MLRNFLLAAFLCLLFATQAPADTCPANRTRGAIPAKQIRIRDVKFDGAIQLPLTEQNEIAASLMQASEDNCGDWLEDLEKTVADAWQQSGFFKVKVNGESHELNSDSDNIDVALNFHVDEGRQYRLEEIQFLHNQQFTSAELRALFSINEGDTFDAHKISSGLAAVRKKYGEIGFINFTCIPESTIDEQHSRISLSLDFEEGKQFHMSRLLMPGFDQKTAEALARRFNLEPGAVFDSRRVDDLARDLNFDSGDDLERRIDEKNAMVSLIVDLRQ